MDSLKEEEKLKEKIGATYFHKYLSEALKLEWKWHFPNYSIKINIFNNITINFSEYAFLPKSAKESKNDCAIVSRDIIRKFYAVMKYNVTVYVD